MMIDWPVEALQKLAKKADLVAWGYEGHPDEVEYHYNTKYVRRFIEAGVPLWAATAYKGAEGADADFADNRERQENALGWMDLSRRLGPFKGVIATAWSRYSTDSLQTIPIDAALDSLVNIGMILRDGRAPADGKAACANLLAKLGEKDRWQKCLQACRSMAARRNASWELVRLLHQLLSFRQRNNAARGSLHMIIRLHARLEERTADLQGKTSDHFRAAFTGLIESVWIDEYLDTRIIPLQDQCEAITEKLAAARDKRNA